MANETPTSSIELIGLQGQVEGVRSELVQTNNGLIGIANLIRTDAAQDQQRLLNERREQQLLAESEIRLGQEQELERKVSASFVQPVNKLEKSLRSSFNGIKKALNFLFTGVFSGVFLKGLGQVVNLGKNTLSGIGGLLTNIFSGVGSVLGIIKNGFGNVIKSIGGVVDDISKGILKLAKSPFKAIADAFKKILQKLKLKPPATPKLPGPGAAAAAEEVGFLTRLGRVASFGLNRILPGAAAVGSAMEGDPLGAAIYGTTAVFPNLFTGTAALAYTFKDELKAGWDKISDKLNLNGFQNSNLFNLFQSDTSDNNQTAAAATPNNTTNTTTSTSTSTTPPSGTVELTIDQSQIQTPPAQQRKLEPPAEPAPDIVYLQSGNQQASTIASGKGEMITDVPLISSANPDNFYTLYAQLNYNVVI